ncbi:MAG TPA: S8 family peptidase [Elusimicrobiota bacterium]|nr:S8 family peptidase [Elusimicrobiota bacterium]
MLKRAYGLVLAAVVSAAFASSARAVEDSSFDTSDAHVREIVLNAKKAVAQQKDADTDASGSPVASKVAAASNDQVVRHIVVFKAGVPDDRKARIIAANGGAVTKDLKLIHGVAAVARKGGLVSFEDSLQNNPDVERVEEDIRQNWLQNAPAVAPAGGAVMPPVWGPQRPPDFEPTSTRDRQVMPWGIEEVHAKEAWSVTRGGGVKVAVVDTGVDSTHPNLRIVGGANMIQPGASYMDDNGHGTHVAGTIGALDGRRGVVGIAPEANIYAVKVLDADGSGTFSDIIAGIQWCADNGIKVANFSLGASRGTPSLQEAVAEATARGVTIVAAAGNSGSDVGFPAAYPEAIAVAATDVNGDVAEFSSRGPQVAIAAPGVNVLSTSPGGGYRNLSGTSMATPHIAGLAVLAIASHGYTTPQEVRLALMRSAHRLPGVPAEQQGAGIPDASRLVQQ